MNPDVGEILLFVKILVIVFIFLSLQRDRYAGKCKIHLCNLKTFPGPEGGGYVYCPICDGEEKEKDNARPEKKT